jgi:hypothetical protein
MWQGLGWSVWPYYWDESKRTQTTYTSLSHRQTGSSQTQYQPWSHDQISRDTNPCQQVWIYGQTHPGSNRTGSSSKQYHPWGRTPTKQNMETGNPATKKKQTHNQAQLMLNHPSLSHYTIPFRWLIQPASPTTTLHLPSSTRIRFSPNNLHQLKSSSNRTGPCCSLQTPPIPTPPLYKAASHSIAHLRSNWWPMNMGPTAAPKTVGKFTSHTVQNP